MGYAEAQYTIDEVNSTTGLPPMAVTHVNIEIKNGNTEIKFMASDSAVDGHIICYVGKVVIVRKVGSAPTSINDGTVVATIDREHVFDYYASPYVLTGDSTLAYYALFTISDHGVVNKEPVVKYPSITFYRAAFHQDFTELDPSKTITYLNWGDISSSQRPMYTNEDTGTPTYGDWANFYVLKENKPYMVKSDFTADYALDPNDYTKKLDGSDSDVSNTSYAGLGAFAWIPKFYMKEVYASNGNSRDVYFSNEKEDSNFKPVGFYDYSVGETNGIWIPMFYPVGSLMAKSLAENDILTGMILATQKQKVDMSGANARFLGGSIMNAYRDLCYLLYKHTNIQEVGGYGNCNGSSNFSNPVLSNGVVSGFKGTGKLSDSSSRKQANKAFHSNVLFSYELSLRDPYTISYGNGSGQKIRLRSTNYYSPDSSDYSTAEGDVYFSSYKSRVNHYGSKLELPPNTKGSTAMKSSINAGNGGASNATGLCDRENWGTDSSKKCIAFRLIGRGYDTACGPAALWIDDDSSYETSVTGFAVMLIPPANYSPS